MIEPSLVALPAARTVVHSSQCSVPSDEQNAVEIENNKDAKMRASIFLISDPH